MHQADRKDKEGRAGICTGCTAANLEGINKRTEWGFTSTRSIQTHGNDISGTIVYFLCEGLQESGTVFFLILFIFAGINVTVENGKRGERFFAYVADEVGDSAMCLQVI